MPLDFQKWASLISLTILVLLIGSGIAFGVWQHSFAAGVWWSCGLLVAGEVFDRRPISERYTHYIAMKRQQEDRT